MSGTSVQPSPARAASAGKAAFRSSVTVNQMYPASSARTPLSLTIVLSSSTVASYIALASLRAACVARNDARAIYDISEEHTSELQTHSDLVLRLLLEKKKTVEMSGWNGYWQ